MLVVFLHICFKCLCSFVSHAVCAMNLLHCCCLFLSSVECVFLYPGVWRCAVWTAHHLLLFSHLLCLSSVVFGWCLTVKTDSVHSALPNPSLCSSVFLLTVSLLQLCFAWLCNSEAFSPREATNTYMRFMHAWCIRLFLFFFPLFSVEPYFSMWNQ